MNASNLVSGVLSFLGQTEEKVLLSAIKEKNIEKIEKILTTAKKNNKIININEKDWGGDYFLLTNVFRSDSKIVKIILNYCRENGINININQGNAYGNYPFLLATFENHIDVMKLIIEYAEDRKISLTINNKNNYGTYPLMWAIYINSIDMVNLIVKYAMKNNIILEISEDDINKSVTFFKNINNSDIQHIYGISDISIEIITVLFIENNNDIIKITYSKKSELLRKIYEISNVLKRTETRKISVKKSNSYFMTVNESDIVYSQSSLNLEENNNESKINKGISIFYIYLFIILILFYIYIFFYFFLFFFLFFYIIIIIIAINCLFFLKKIF